MKNYDRYRDEIIEDASRGSLCFRCRARCADCDHVEDENPETRRNCGDIYRKWCDSVYCEHDGSGCEQPDTVGDKDISSESVAE